MSISGYFLDHSRTQKTASGKYGHCLLGATNTVFGRYCLSEVINNDLLFSHPSGDWSLVLESADNNFPQFTIGPDQTISSSLEMHNIKNLLMGH